MIAIAVVVAITYPEFGADLKSLIDAWRLLCVSVTAFSIGMNVVIASRVFRNAVWYRIGASFSLLLLLAAIEQASRIGTDYFTWRLPLFTLALYGSVLTQWQILRRRVSPYDKTRR